MVIGTPPIKKKFRVVLPLDCISFISWSNVRLWNGIILLEIDGIPQVPVDGPE